MKKIYTTISAVLLMTSITFAQEFGVKGGVAMTNLYGADWDIDDFGDEVKNPLKIGLNVAGFARFGDGPLGFTAEAGFSQKGTVLKSNLVDDALGTLDAQTSWTLNYIDFNAIGNYFISDYVSLNAGLGISFLISGKLKNEYDATGAYSGLYNDSEDDAEIGEDISGLDFGANLGASFYLNESMHIEARYYLGLAPIDPNDDPDSVFNNAIMITFAYGFAGIY